MWHFLSHTTAATPPQAQRAPWGRRGVLLALVCGLGWPAAQAHGDPSGALSALSVLPVASVVVTASTAAGAVLALPVASLVTGTVLVVKLVEVTARGTVYVLERASDGARLSIELTGRGLEGVSLGVGTAVTVSVIGTGTLLSVAGEVIAFIPNALGRALLHDERFAD